MLEKIKKELKGLDFKLLAWVVSVELVIISLFCTTVGAGYLAYEFRNELLIEREKVTLYEECVQDINSGINQPRISVNDGDIHIEYRCE